MFVLTIFISNLLFFFLLNQKAIISKEVTFHDLYQKSDVELNNYLKSLDIRELDLNNITAAFFNLKEFCNNLEKGLSNSSLKPTTTKPNPIIDINNSYTSNTTNINGLSSIPSSTSTSISTSGSGSTSSILVNSVVDSKLKPLNLISPNASTSAARSKQQRKSESEINSFLINNSPMNPILASNNDNKLFSKNSNPNTTNSAQIVTFSPILPKSNKSK